MAARGAGSPESVCISLGSFTSATNNAARYHVPDRPHGEGIVVRRVMIRAGAETGAADIDVEVRNQTTSMLSSAVTLTGTATRTATLANDGQEIVGPGRYIRFDIADGGKLEGLSFLSNIVVQLDFERLGRSTGGGVR